MARRRRERMSEGKKNIIAGLIQEYKIKSAEDIQEALKDLLGGTIQEMMEAELDEHLGYDEYERSDNPDYRNGVKHKKLRSSYGEIPIDVPQDRDGDFEPQIVQKRKKDISAIEQKIIAMSAKGMTTRQISDIIEDIYGFEVSESMVTAVTNKILPQIEEWQQRPLSAVYPIVFIDAIHFSVRDEHIVKKIAAPTSTNKITSAAIHSFPNFSDNLPDTKSALLLFNTQAIATTAKSPDIAIYSFSHASIDNNRKAVPRMIITFILFRTICL